MDILDLAAGLYTLCDGDLGKLMEATAPPLSSEENREEVKVDASDGPKWLNPEPDISDNAEIWQTYVTEAKEMDEVLMKKWNEGIDVFLLFTGLFSAILSAFLVVAWSTLQPDPSQTASDALGAISQQLVTLSSGKAMDASAAYEPPGFSAPWWAVAVNCLWFTSLFISLLCAVLSMLIKEWLTAYNDRVARVPLQRVMERQMRFEGINDWHVPSIITILPLAIHVAVFLFLLGLVLFAWPVSIVLFILLTLLLLLGLGLYTTLAVLPLLFPGCPYKSPLVSVLDFFGRHMKNILYRALRTHRKLRKVRRPTLNEYTLGGGGGETDFIKRNGFDLQAKAMVWMASSPNRIVRDHALHILSRYTMLTAQFQKVSSDITRAAENALADYASMTEQRDDIVLPKETMESLCLISTLTTHAYVPRNHLNSWLYPANEVLDKFVGLTKNSRYGNDMGLPRLVAVLSDTCEEKAGECLVLGRGWRRPEISTGTYVEMERALTLIHSSAPDISYLSASLEYWTFLLELKPIPALFL